jgi:predicted AlkP superfamily pyrophosphatase or phosphodiesterase
MSQSCNGVVLSLRAMNKIRLLSLLVVSLYSFACAAAPSPVLVISVDGLHPAYVTEADRHGLKIPTLRRMLKEGTHARVVGVVPTVTYPSHTTLMTGVTPQQHGILSNTPFDPLNVNKEGWYWYAEDIKATTLWEVASAAGLRTASINWPVTVGDKHIAFLMPEYWRASTADDLKLMRQLDRPEGLMEKLEAKLGPYIDGYVGTVESDWTRTRFTIAMIREYKPQLMATHIIALDEIEHERGPFVAPAFATLEQLDKMIGEMLDAALAVDPSTVLAVVSDHGFIATHTAVNLRTKFVEAGWIKLKQNAAGATVIDDWQAQLWNGAASAAVVLRDPANKEVKDRVAALLKSLAAEPRNGIAQVLDKAALQASGGFPGAEFLVEFAPGFYFGGEVRGDMLRPAVSKGTHGYLPSRPELHASLFIRGPNIDAGRDLGVIDMRQIAPTLASILGVRLPHNTEPTLALTTRRFPSQPASSPGR